jgi:hypothetical protein
VRQRLAFWTWQAGDLQAGMRQYAALLPVRERVSGPEDPSTLSARFELARLKGNTGDAAAARDELAALAHVSERVLGAEDHHTLVVRTSLAQWTGRAGAAVRTQLSGQLDGVGRRPSWCACTVEALLPLVKRVLGAEHPDTLVIQRELADWTGAAGDPAAARAGYTDLVPVFERVRGSEHPHTLSARDSLARWTEKAGDEISQP